MTVGLELIEMLRERADVSYEEARDALEKCNSDVVEALIYLEKQNKIKTDPKDNSCASGFGASVKKAVKTCNETRFQINKNEQNIIDLPVTIGIITTVIAPPLTVVGLLAALFTGHKIRLERPGHEEFKFNKTLDDISNAATKVSAQVADAVNQK
ncbi:MAG: DUF4342 domain-containing protein [Syntrophomonadaceae bacterium]|nr:DUF4342 domain-containing protein [Syntrophomonadaceae bacterium]